MNIRAGRFALGLAAGLAVLLVQSLYFHALPSLAHARAWHALVAAPVAGILGFAIYRVVTWLQGRLTDRSGRSIAFAGALFAVAGWFLTWAIPVPPAPDRLTDVEVHATGRKAATAQSSEVWVRLELDGAPIPPDEIRQDGNWHVDGDFLVSVPGRQPASLYWAGADRVRLVFVSHPWSGHAEVRIGGDVESVELYSPKSDARIIPATDADAADDRLVYPDRNALERWVQFSDSVSIGALLLGLFLALASRPLRQPVLPVAALRYEVLLHATPTLLVSGALLALFFPAVMTSDSLDQWRQTETGNYNDAHPLLYALLIRASRFLWDSPALVVSLQAVSMAFAVAWLLVAARRALGARVSLAHLGAWLVALHPMVALANITLWKDVFYTVTVVVLTAFLVEVVFVNKSRLRQPIALLGLFIAVAACFLLRHNGPPVAMTALLLLFVAAPEARRQVALVAIVAISFALVLKGPIAKAMDSQPVNFEYSLYAHHVAAHIASDAPVPPEDAEWLSRLRPLDEWDYTCSLVNPTINNGFDGALASSDSRRLLDVWLGLAKRNPGVELSHVLCVSGLVWRITGDAGGPLYLYKTGLYRDGDRVRWIMDHESRIVERSTYNPASQALGVKLLELKNDLVWRPALLLYVFVSAVFVAVYRYRNRRWLMVLALIVVHTGVLAVASVAQDARYQLPAYVLSLALIPILLVGSPLITQNVRRTRRSELESGAIAQMIQSCEPLQPESITVVIPCYRVTTHIVSVIDAIGDEVARIYCVDDACPDGSGDFIERHISDPRVRVLRHARNQGVGGAVMTGYRQASFDGAAVVVKIDGDGQMDPRLLPDFVAPILAGEADYTKGNRFWSLREIRQMPLARRIGNLGLSFFAKASTGYWDLFDPTNGYTAIHASVAARLPMESISHRYFFETDVLFRLNAMRAVVVDIPMDARYGDEVSNLHVSKVFGEFLGKHVINSGKRIGYSYFLRDLSIGSLELVAAVALLGFGFIFGGWHWWVAAGSGESAPLGTVMIATIAVVSGLQFLLAFLNYDIASVPRRPLHRVLSRSRRRNPAETGR